MFDRYMLVEGTLKALKDPDATGFSVGIRFPHHCGIWLSIVEQILLTVDGEAVSVDRLTLSLNDKKYRVGSLQEEREDRWAFGEIATLTVHTDEPLPPGEHTLSAEIALRVSFLAWPLTGKDTKRMALCSVT